MNFTEQRKAVRVLLSRVIGWWRFRSTADYWERRYASGGDSGAGSTGDLAVFKATVINNLVDSVQPKRVLEFGCGDGRQLERLRIDEYIGLDVSRSAIDQCVTRFRADQSKSFFWYDSSRFVDNALLFSADLTISIDVIYHLIEEDLFDGYLRQVFKSARKYVLIYSSDFDSAGQAAHVRHRSVTKWVKENGEHWTLVLKIPNKFPIQKFQFGSHADFFLFQREGVDVDPDTISKLKSDCTSD